MPSLPIALDVNLPDPAQGILYVRERMPVQSGLLTLCYPKYSPGDHSSNGPIRDLMGLTFTIGDQRIKWHRDATNMYVFSLVIPADARCLDIHFELPVPSRTTPYLLDLDWNHLLLYRADWSVSDHIYAPTLVIPEHWHFASALQPIKRLNGRISFKAVTLDRLIDSPVIAGRYMCHVDLSPGSRVRHWLAIVADRQEVVELTAEQLASFRQLIQQGRALFRSRHYKDYRFLVVLSDYTSRGSMEHRQSSVNRPLSGSKMFIDTTSFMLDASLLPHEYVHSWNGKFRLPHEFNLAGLQGPVHTEMLWVYEGLTTYLGDILTARSGLWSKKTYREMLAYRAAMMAYRYGRAWRPLSDTAVAAQLVYGMTNAWSNWRRTIDFYREGELLWLAVDTKIRTLSGRHRSLDDFVRLFFRNSDGLSNSTYTFQDVVVALDEVQPYDWARFLSGWLSRTGTPGPLLSGIRGSGWRLVYTDEPSHYQNGLETVGPDQLSSAGINMLFSIGLFIKENAEIADVLWHGPAFGAGIAPGMRILAVNGDAYSREALRDAIRVACEGNEPIRLTTHIKGVTRTYTVPYTKGLRYPHLVRVPSEPNLLDDILCPAEKKTSSQPRYRQVACNGVSEALLSNLL